MKKYASVITAYVGVAILLVVFTIMNPNFIKTRNLYPLVRSICPYLLVGIGQAIATVPGLSRSGTTIAVGLLRGFDRRYAVRFSFLLSLPAILGANILSLKDAVEAGINWSMLPAYLLGTAVAAVVGYFAIRLVNLLTDRGKFGNFAYYCWAVGALALILSIIL